MSFVPFRAAAIQMVSTPDVAENLEHAAALIARAAADGAKLISLPEYFCLMGLHDSDKLDVQERDGEGPIQSFLSEQAREHGVWLAGGTLPLVSPESNRVFNTALVYAPDGQRRSRYDKIHLFKFDNGEESFDESQVVKPGGDAVSFDMDGARIGQSVCYDLRFPELYRSLGDVALMLVPSAFVHRTGKAHWEVLLRSRAIENQCYVLAAAQGGEHENGRRTWGHSMLIDPWGEIVDVLEVNEGVVAGTIDPSRLSDVRASLPALQHRVM